MNILQKIKRWLQDMFGVSCNPRPSIQLKPKRFVGYGINVYPNPKNNLAGCVNDLNDWGNFAVSKLGFEAENVRKLQDSQATKKNILDSWSWAIDGIAPGDLVIITCSGHGAQVPDANGDEIDKLDEIICPYDFAFKNSNTYITDDEVNVLFSNVPNGALVIMIVDCCHSATMNRTVRDDLFPKRILPPDDILALFSEKEPVVRSMSKAVGNEGPRNLVLLSGCKTTEFSYDASFNGRNNGAFTYTLMKIFNEVDPRLMTYKELIDTVNKKITEPQTPQLCCYPEFTGVHAFCETT